MWAAAALGFALGISLAAPPGPMNALIAQHAARHGWRTGIQVGVAAPVADTVYLVVFAAGVAPWLEDHRGLLRVAALAGAVLMAWFAWQAWRGDEDEVAPRTGFAKAFAAAMTNPYQIAWWLTVGAVMAADQGWPWVAGFLLGIFGWVVAFSLLVAAGARRWAWFTPTVRVVATVVLAGFAVLMALYAAGVALL